jgi:ADP-L-glycero-D-manno-heptose 6-epimerase
VGTAKSRTFYDLAATVYRALGKEPSITYRDTPEEIRDKYQYYTEARMDKLRAQGYDAPMTSLEDGITEYVQQYLDADDPYR